MRSGSLVFLLLVGAAWVGCCPASAQRTKPEGAWIVSDRVAIQVFDCSGSLCGRIVWLRNPALRTSEMCGKTIIWGLTPDGPAHWSNGWFFDPENGSTYNLSAELQSADRIFARVYKGVSWFGRTEILTRIRREVCGAGAEPVPSERQPNGERPCVGMTELRASGLSLRAMSAEVVAASLSITSGCTPAQAACLSPLRARTPCL
jgi:uncharacterized protein (DUF2147 family)